jgi:hypothetical protein
LRPIKILLAEDFKFCNIKSYFRLKLYVVPRKDIYGQLFLTSLGYLAPTLIKTLCALEEDTVNCPNYVMISYETLCNEIWYAEEKRQSGTKF